MNATPVQVTDLRKTYGGTAALDGVDLSVGTGQVHGLLGPNGAGKTTLLRVLLGLVRPDSGTATLLGSPAAPARGGVAGFVDAPRAWPYLTGRRNLELLGRLDAVTGDIEGVLEQVGLTDTADTKVGGWSTGMRQRLGLAAALLRTPRVLVLDEPTSGLDPAGVADVHGLLRLLAEGGTTVLLSSHDMVEVASLCSDVTVLARGRVRFHGSMAELRAGLPPVEHRLRTADDARAAQVAGTHRGLTVVHEPAGLRVRADVGQLDAYILALGAHGIPVRALGEEGDPLTRAFLELTA